MPEGKIYLCSWTKTKSNYSLELRANPDLQYHGPDLEECMEEICMQIADWNGDGEAVLELFPPAGRKRLVGGSILFAVMGYNHSVRAIDYRALFADGACPVCKFGIGERSDAVLRVESPPQGIVCSLDACYPVIAVFDRSFVDAMSDSERGLFDIRPVIAGGKESSYVELVARHVVKTVGYKGADYPTAFQQSFRCGSCGREKFVVDAPKYKPDTVFIDERDVDGLASTMIVVDDSWRQSPAFRLDRWKELLGRRENHGLLSDPLVVLDSRYVETPVLDTCVHFDWFM